MRKQPRLMCTAEVNSVTLTYDDHGPADGPPVLLVHGHPFNRTLWQPQAEVLTSAGYRVITPDLRGYGDSPASGDTVHLADFADDLVGLLDHLRIPEAVIGGVSMGGQITMELHARHPHRVSAMVLSDTSAPAETAEGKLFRRRLADRLLAEGMDGYAEEVIDKMLAAYNVSALPHVADRVLTMMRTTDPRGAAAALRGRAERADYRPSLARASCPVLLLVGADDVYTPLADAEEIRRHVPHARLVAVDRAGHLPGAEQPEKFNRHLLDFLTREVLLGTQAAASPKSPSE